MGSHEVVLLNPPFFRACGSHNDRMPLSLCYLSAILERESISHKLYNADFAGSDTYWGMRHLFDNFDSFRDAVDNQGSLYDEAIQEILAFNPSVVVIMGADPLLPTKDLGSPYIAANFSKRLRKLGIFTVGIGPYFTLDTQRFIHDFDSVLGGEPSEKIVDIIRRRPRGFIMGGGVPPDLLPSLEHLYPDGQKTDAVMSSFGCLHRCSFCVAGKLYRSLGKKIKYVSPQKVAEDISRRREERIYLVDLNFSVCPVSRLKELLWWLEKMRVKKEFVIESTVQGLSEERLGLYRKMGVSTIKLGLEGLTRRLLTGFNKKHSVREVREVVNSIRKYEMNFIAYLLIGGTAPPEEYQKTREILKTLDPDNVVVSIWAYNTQTDYRYDTQFSPVTLKKWGISRDVFYDYLRLQKEHNLTVGRVMPG